MNLLPIYRFVSCPVNLEIEDVVPLVTTHNIMQLFLRHTEIQVKLSICNSFLVAQLVTYLYPIRSEELGHGIRSVVKYFFCIFVMNRDDLLYLFIQNSSTNDRETLCFKAMSGSSDSIGSLVQISTFPLCWPSWWIALHMDLFPLGHHRVPRKRIRVLATDQNTYFACLGSLSDDKTSPIAIAPDKFFIVSWHKLPMMSPHFAIPINQHIRVPQASHTMLRSFAESKTNYHTSVLCFAANLSNLRTVSIDGSFHESREEISAVYGRTGRCKDGEARNKGFGKADQMGARISCFIDQTEDLLCGCSCVQEYGRCMTCCYFHGRKRSHFGKPSQARI